MASPLYVEIEIATDYLVSSDAEELLSSKIRLPRKSLSLSELLRLKLAQEIHAYNERKTESYGAEYLSAEEYAEILAEGKEFLGDPLKKGKVNPDTEFRLALRAFNEHKFKVIINNKEPRVAREKFDIDENTTIRFVRLVPYR